MFFEVFKTELSNNCEIEMQSQSGGPAEGIGGKVGGRQWKCRISTLIDLSWFRSSYQAVMESMYTNNFWPL